MTRFIPAAESRERSSTPEGEAPARKVTAGTVFGIVPLLAAAAERARIRGELLAQADRRRSGMEMAADLQRQVGEQEATR